MGIGSNRRGFLTKVSGWVAGAAAVATVQGCERAATAIVGPEAEPEDDHGMHGPVRVADKALELPEASSALALFAPHTDGKPFLRRWALGRVARGDRNQIVLVVVDTDTGGHAEMEVYTRDAKVRPIAETEKYAVMTHNGARGDSQTPLHMRRLSERLAEIIADNEHVVTLDWQIPTLRQAVAAEEAAKAELDALDGHTDEADLVLDSGGGSTEPSHIAP